MSPSCTSLKLYIEACLGLTFMCGLIISFTLYTWSCFSFCNSLIFLSVSFCHCDWTIVTSFTRADKSSNLFSTSCFSGSIDSLSSAASSLSESSLCSFPTSKYKSFSQETIILNLRIAMLQSSPMWCCEEYLVVNVLLFFITCSVYHWQQR